MCVFSAHVLNSCQEVEYKAYELSEPAAELPLHVFEALPPKERGIVVFNVQVQTEKEISLVVSGATYSFRQQSQP